MGIKISKKRIVVCSDGTWNTPTQRDRDTGKPVPTNVVKTARTISGVSKDGIPQVVFYDEGVGADKWGLDRLTGGAFGWGLIKNIEDVYRFLMWNYVEGDEIFLFGFSRGAYTVRSLVGLIRNCGLLKPINADKLKAAFELYRNDLHPDCKYPKNFRRNYSIEVDAIKFLGVWDTVGAYGIPLGLFRWFNKKRYQFHDFELSKIVKNAYHALAIDEKREIFEPSLWKYIKKEGQYVEQVWFPGVHSDIGGGYPDSGLSDISFWWMKEKAEDCGLEFDEKSVEAMVDPDICGKMHKSRVQFYKLRPPFFRPIGKEETEALHPCVEYRHKKTNYKPVNLVNYMADGNPKVAVVKNWPIEGR
jgi:uncharacterized protein (DUF2235 family)